MNEQELDERSAKWLAEFRVKHKMEIWKLAANPLDPRHMPQCFGVGQHAAILAKGWLLYHEGTACYRETPNSMPTRHAWNTLCGVIVDLSQYCNSADGSFVDACEVYEKYQVEQTYAVEEVRERMAPSGVWDFFVRPQYDFSSMEE